MTHFLLTTNRNYRLIFSASTVSNLGDGVSSVALPWLATVLTRDPMLIASVAMAQRLPWFLFALPAGVWTDRLDRRQLMVRADLVRLALTLCIVAMCLNSTSWPLPDGNGAGPILILICLAFLLGCAEVLRDNAAQTVLPSIVHRDDLERANGQMWSAEQVMGHFIGPPLAGLLIGAGIALPFGFDAATFAISAALIWMIALPPRKPQSELNFWAALKQAALWLKGNWLILQLALMLGAINAVFIGGMSVMVLYAQEVLNLTAAQYGLLLTAGAFGGVIGGYAAPKLIPRIGLHNALLFALALFAGLQCLIGLFSSTALTATALFLESFAAMFWNVATVSFRQRVIPDHLLGRVNAIYRFFGWGAMPFGALIAGALVSGLESDLGRPQALHAPYLLAAGVCFLLLIYAWVSFRQAPRV